MARTLLVAALALLAGAGVGGFVGWWIAHLSVDAIQSERDARADAFHKRLEVAVPAPTCEDLKAVGVFGPRSAGDITYYLDVRADYYYVVGFATSDPQGPQLSWFGAANTCSQ